MGLGFGASEIAPNSAGPPTLTVSATKCAPGWSAPRSGLTVFNVRNTSRSTVYSVDLLGGDQTLVYGEIEMLAPGTEDQMDALLPPGKYSFECDAFSGESLLSDVRRVSGPPVAGPTLTCLSRRTRSNWPRWATGRA